MNVVIETLFLRHPRFEYISPAICEAIFSGSGSPVIVLDPISHLLRPSGGVLGGTGAGDGRHLSWVGYPGALCYSFWMAADPNNPESPYNLVSECVTPNSILLCNPGFYYITAVTAAGEGPLSSPIEVGGDGSSYYTIPLPKTPGVICYQLYKSFTIGGAIVLYWSCFSGDEVHFQTCLPGCYKMSVITIDGETPLSDPFCPEPPCDIQDPEIGQELCGPDLTWNQALCACGPCEAPTPCAPGTHWDVATCSCVANPTPTCTIVDWDSMTWTEPLVGEVDGGIATYDLTGGAVAMKVEIPSGIAFASVANTVGTVLYTGAGCLCRAMCDVRQYDPGVGNGGLKIRQDGSVIADIDPGNYVTGDVTPIDFVVSPGTASVITIEGRWQPSGIFGPKVLIGGGFNQTGVIDWITTMTNLPCGDPPDFSLINWGALGVFTSGGGGIFDSGFTPQNTTGNTISGFATTSGYIGFGPNNVCAIQCDGVLQRTGAGRYCVFTATTSIATGDPQTFWKLSIVGDFPTIVLQYEPGNPGKTVWPFTLPPGTSPATIWAQIQATDSDGSGVSRAEVVGTFSLV